MTKIRLKNINPHPKQWEIINDPARFKVIICGRRFGKTHIAVFEMIRRAISKPKQNIWYVAETYAQAEMIAWKLMVNTVPREFVKKINETKLRIEFNNNSFIELKGVENADRLRGVRIDFIIMDEYAKIKPVVFEEVVRPALTDSEGSAWFVGTPKGYNHFFSMYKATIAGAEGYEDFSAHHYTSYDNPYLNPKEIDRARAQISEDAFAQEYLGEFKKRRGLVYPEFSKEKNVINLQSPKQEWTCYRSIDFGLKNPTAVLFIGVDSKDNIFIFDEIYKADLTTSELSHLIKAKNPATYFTQTFGDSASAQSIKDLADIYQIPIIPVKKNTGAKFDDWIMSGIEKVKSKLIVQEGTGKPKLFVASHCVNTIMEFESYCYPEKSTDDMDLASFTDEEREKIQEEVEQEKPQKINDHSMDAFRYFMMSYVPNTEMDAEKELYEYQSDNKYNLY